MKKVKYWIILFVETLLRLLPFPCKRGLLKIGNPGRNAPVFLTCNFHLTVERVKRALEGMDCYLLVANSRGINVWCAATGGLFTNHDVISAIKTSGIEELVDHKKIILPQLAATGIELKEIKKKTAWTVIWGPVYAKDIPEFIEREQLKTPEMSQVIFPLSQRLEMGVAWAFPISLVMDLVLFFIWPSALLPMTGLVWAMALALFIAFPLYGHLLRPGQKTVGFVFFDFGKGAIQLILWGLLTGGLWAYSFSGGNLSSWEMIHWAIAFFVVVLLFSMDLAGSTPLLKSTLHDDGRLAITLDREKCKGPGFCDQVCPRQCFEVDKTERKASMPRDHLCVRCGACIVQCPFDALYFSTLENEIIPPEQIRKFKLNMMGQRKIEAK